MTRVDPMKKSTRSASPKSAVKPANDQAATTSFSRLPEPARTPPPHPLRPPQIHNRNSQLRHPHLQTQRQHPRHRRLQRSLQPLPHELLRHRQIPPPTLTLRSLQSHRPLPHRQPPPCRSPQKNRQSPPRPNVRKSRRKTKIQRPLLKFQTRNRHLGAAPFLTDRKST